MTEKEKRRARRVAEMHAQFAALRPTSQRGLKTRRGKLDRIRRLLKRAGFDIVIREIPKCSHCGIRQFLLKSIERSEPILKDRGAALG